MAIATCGRAIGVGDLRDDPADLPFCSARSSAYFQWNIIDWLSTALPPAL